MERIAQHLLSLTQCGGICRVSTRMLLCDSSIYSSRSPLARRCGLSAVCSPCRQYRSIDSKDTATISASNNSRKKRDHNQVQARIQSSVASRDVSSAIQVLTDHVQSFSSITTTTTTSSTFSWAALTSTLHLCVTCGKEKEGIQLLTRVRELAVTAAGHGKRGVLQEGFAAWCVQRNTLTVMLRLQCAVRDDREAAHLMSFILQHRHLRHRMAATYLQYCLEIATEEEEKTTKEDRIGVSLSRSVALLRACREQKVRLELADVEAVGRLVVLAQQKNQREAGKNPVVIPTAIASELLHAMKVNALPATQEFVAAVWKPWREGDAFGWASVTVAPPPPPPAAAPTTASATTPFSLPRCPHCSQPFQKQPFSFAEREVLLDILENEITTGRSSSPKNKKAKTPGAVARVQEEFARWKNLLAHNESDGYDVFIDGANVGYCGLTKWYSGAAGEEAQHKASKREVNHHIKQLSYVDVSLDFPLIERAFAALQEAGFRKPLLFLHSRHRDRALRSPAHAALLEKWEAARSLYYTPTGSYDDGWWLYGALAQRPSKSSHGIYVLSNDLLRDLHFSMASLPAFTRWREQYMIRYHCERVEGVTHLRLEWPSTYSRTAQVVKEEASGVVGKGTVRERWHVPMGKMVSTAEGAAQQQQSSNGADAAIPLSSSETSTAEEWVCLHCPSSGDLC